MYMLIMRTAASDCAMYQYTCFKNGVNVCGAFRVLTYQALPHAALQLMLQPLCPFVWSVCTTVNAGAAARRWLGCSSKIRAGLLAARELQWFNQELSVTAADLWPQRSCTGLACSLRQDS